MWQVIESFKKEDSLSKVTSQEVNRGVKDPNKKRRLSYETRQKELKILAKNYKNMNKGDYLRAVARLF